MYVPQRASSAAVLLCGSRACCLVRLAKTALPSNPSSRWMNHLNSLVYLCGVRSCCVYHITSQVNLGEQRVVTAILVLCGLPYASFSSVLAHEATHAWMKLDPSFPTHLPSQVRVCVFFVLFFVFVGSRNLELNVWNVGRIFSRPRLLVFYVCMYVCMLFLGHLFIGL